MCRPYSIIYKKLTKILDGALKIYLIFILKNIFFQITLIYYIKMRVDFFEPHRDDVKTGHLKDMIDEGYKIYTVIICLENAFNYNDGSTLVWSKYDNSKYHFTMKRHIFNTGSKKGNVLIFNSDLLHGVTHTRSSILKLKFEIGIKNYNYERFNRMNYYKCKCETCNSKSKIQQSN